MKKGMEVEQTFTSYEEKFSLKKDATFGHWDLEKNARHSGGESEKTKTKIYIKYNLIKMDFDGVSGE